MTNKNCCGLGHALIFDARVNKMLAAAEEGSLSKAAQKLYVSQPTLSVQVSQLEDELGFQVFERGSKGVTLTDAGESLVKDLESLSKKADEAVRRAQQVSQQQ